MSVIPYLSSHARHLDLPTDIQQHVHTYLADKWDLVHASLLKQLLDIQLLRDIYEENAEYMKLQLQDLHVAQYNLTTYSKNADSTA
jgi:hypothetical protein